MGRDLPILFSGPMVLALLAGTKTETRRLLYGLRKAKPDASISIDYDRRYLPTGSPPPDHYWSLRRRFEPGQRLWVRESVQAIVDAEEYDAIRYLADGHVARSAAATREEADRYADQLYGYRDRKGAPDRRTGVPVPSIHMPRWASRITLPVTEVRIERLNDITEEAALAEGVVPHPNGGFHVPGIPHPDPNWPYLSRPTAREMYAALWDVINGSGAWGENPWVSVTRFDVIPRNIDHV